MGALVPYVDRATDTVYVSNQTENTISVLPRSTCSARDHTGCPTTTPPSAPTGNQPAADGGGPRAHTLYVQVQDADVIQALDVRACNAHHTSGCAARSRTAQTGGEPFWVTSDPRTRTVYTVDHVDGVLEVFDPRACSAVSRRGCRREARSVRTAPGTSTSADPVRHTLYEPGQDGVLHLTDLDRCRVGHAAACVAAGRQVTVGQGELGGSTLDLATHTLYFLEFASRRVLLVDTARCNVSRIDGCRPVAAVTLRAEDVARVTLNSRTHTLYVVQGGPLGIAVLRGARCNAMDLSGCGATPRVVDVGPNPYSVAVDETSNTVYASNYAEEGGYVALLPGTACDAGTDGCRSVARTNVPEPTGQTVDEATRTLFVPRLGDNTRGGVSLVDIRTCNAGHTTGCGTAWPLVPGPRGVFTAQVVSSGRTLFTHNIFDSTVSVIDIRHCNGADRSGCPTRPRRIAVGYAPLGSTPSPSNGTVYVSTNEDRSQSLIDLRHPCRHHLCFR